LNLNAGTVGKVKVWKIGRGKLAMIAAIVVFVVYAVRAYIIDSRQYGTGYIKCFEGDATAQIDCWTRYLDGGGGGAHARASAFLFRGYAYREKQQFDLALKDSEQAISLEPDNTSNIVLNARALLDTRDCGGAIKAWTRSIYLQPNLAPRYSERAGAYLCKADYDDAIANLNQAIHLNPIAHYYYRKRAEVWKATGNGEKAQADLTTAVSLEGRSDEAICRDERYRRFDCWTYLNAWLPD
jgi:tetratricopeptide (TPR) repeat protein